MSSPVFAALKSIPHEEKVLSKNLEKKNKTKNSAALDYKYYTQTKKTMNSENISRMFIVF